MCQRIYKMKNILLLLMIFLFASGAKSQVMNFGIHGGYGYYNLEDIKSLQTIMLSAVKLPGLKAVEVFPDNIYYGFSIGSSANSRKIYGMEFSYFTTGGRNHLADYSGEYKADIIVSGYQMGPKFEDYYLQTGRFRMGLKLAGGVLVSVLKVDERLTVFNEELSADKLVMISPGWFAEPSLKFLFNLPDGLNINFSGGYSFNENGKLRTKDGKSNYAADWSGIRTSIGINYNFNMEK